MPELRFQVLRNLDPGNLTSVGGSEAYREWARELTKWQRRGEASRQRIVDNYSFDKMANTYADIWRKVAAEAA